MKYAYQCPKCGNEHGGQTPSVMETLQKECDKCRVKLPKGYYEKVNLIARLKYATMVSGAPIYDVKQGEYL